MRAKGVVCSMCGYRYSLAENSTCRACPLNPGCGLACCPMCGFESIDPSQSSLVRWLSSVLAKLQVRGLTGKLDSTLPFHLLDAPQGSQVIIRSFSDQASAKICERLQAYGLSPGVRATLLQVSPVVILQVENLELVLEQGLARQIQVSSAAG